MSSFPTLSGRLLRLRMTAGRAAAPPFPALFFLYKVKLKFTSKEESPMEPIADDPIVASLERTGYPPWMRA